MSNKTPLQSLLDDKEVMEEMRDSAASKKKNSFTESFTPMGKREVLGLKETIEILDSERPSRAIKSVEEAIVLTTGRPSLFIRNGIIDEPTLQVWKRRLSGHKSAIESGVVPSVGRIELLNNPDFDWVGTGWMVAPTLLATNRHVAEVFARKGPGGYPFLVNPSGVAMSARIDFAEEVGATATREVEIEKVLYVAETGQADIAILQVKSSSILPGVIPLATRDALPGTLVGVVGYPAYDSRNDVRAMRSIFGDTFDIKRFAPGYATGTDATTMRHDCSTLGGNSGSPVFSLERREILGLHFSGRFGVSNYAVKASVIRSVLSGVRPTSVLVGGSMPLSPLDEGRTRSELELRRGYDEAFLGTTARLRVSMPNLSAEQMEDAVVAHPGHRGQSAYILDYMHFSLAMCKSRRTAYFTAVNIDGNRTVAVSSRRPAWIRDPRIPADDQIGDEVYGGRNNVDRGHLVRRLDPVWGDPADAKQANDDTHIFTNAAPQQHTYNDAVWGDLEDYLLDNTRRDHQKLTIFTGPVFRDGDMDFKGAQIPEEFWKVAVAVGEDDELRAAGYVVSQRPYLDDLEFIPGRFRTFQRSIRDVEELTGLDFGVLRTKDVMGGSESVAVEPRVIRGPADVSL